MTCTLTLVGPWLCLLERVSRPSPAIIPAPACSWCRHLANIPAIVGRLRVKNANWVCNRCMTGNNLFALPRATALMLLGLAESPLDQPYSRPGQMPGFVLCYENIKVLVLQAGPPRNIFYDNSLQSKTSSIYRDVSEKDLKHCWCKDIWVRLGGAFHS